MSKIILNEQQERIKNDAVNWFHFSSEQVFEISGCAGTGKTVLIKEILTALRLKPTEYYAMSFTGQASIVMRTRGFTNAKSIHSTLYETIEVPVDYGEDYPLVEKFGIRRVKKKFVPRVSIPENIVLFFIDEGYMVPKSMVTQILRYGVKVIVAGDSHQLPPIGDEPGFLVNPGVHHLTQLMRQAETNPIVYIANRAINNEPIHCGQYGNDVLIIPDTEFIPQMIGFADCICCGTNYTRELMNNYVRKLANFEGPIPKHGERIICRKNNWNEDIDGIALANGLAGVVMNNPDIMPDKSFTVDFKPDLANVIFADIKVNYDYFIASPSMKNYLKESYSSKFLQGEFFDFAYCLTTHLCQGSEYQNGIFIEEFMRPNMQNQLIYTGVTRFKKKLIYVKKTNKNFYIPNS